MSAMPYEQYAVTVKPQLQRIEWFACRIKTFVGFLPVRPGFQTMAETMLDDAEKDLQRALATVQAAKRAYHALPIDGESRAA